MVLVIKRTCSRLNKDDKSPGPGQYAPDGTRVKKKAPNYRFGTEPRLRSAVKFVNPDPHSYQVKDDLMRTTHSSWGMGYGTKVDLSKTLADTPGPGSYEFQTKIDEGKKYGMGLRKNMFELKRDDSPGPGQYKSEVVDLKKSAQSYKWGRDNRFSKSAKKNASPPGPGMYENKPTLGGPLYGFGTSTRPGNQGKSTEGQKDLFPGPGHYDQARSLESYKPYEGKAK